MYSYGEHFVEDNLIPYHIPEMTYEGVGYSNPLLAQHHKKHTGGNLLETELMNVVGDDGPNSSTGYGSIFPSGFGKHHSRSDHHSQHRIGGMLDHHPLMKLLKPEHKLEDHPLHHHVGGNILLSLLPTLIGAVAGPLVNKAADFLFPSKKGEGIINSEGVVTTSETPMSEPELPHNFETIIERNKENPEESMVHLANETPEYLHKILDMMEFMMERLDKNEMDLLIHEAEDKGLLYGCGRLLHHHSKKHGTGFEGLHEHLHHKKHLRHKHGGSIFPSGFGKHHSRSDPLVAQHHSGNGISDIPIIGPLLGLFGIK
jgi:hypothetical protein